MKRGLCLLAFVLVFFITLVSASELRVTPGHPFFVDGNWVRAGELEIGDVLTRDDGSKVRVTSIEDVNSHSTVYNIAVSGLENYFANRVLVHNKPMRYDAELGYSWEGLSRESRIRLEELLMRQDHEGTAISLTWEGRNVATQTVVENLVPNNGKYVEVGVGQFALDYRGVRTRLQARGVTTKGLEINPSNIPLDLPDGEIVLADVLDLNAAGKQVIQQADVIRMSNVEIYFRGLKDRQALFSGMKQNMKEGAALIISDSYNMGAELPGEQGFLYVKQGDKLVLQKYLYNFVVKNKGFYFGGNVGNSLIGVDAQKIQGMPETLRYFGRVYDGAKDSLITQPWGKTDAWKEFAAYVRDYNSMTFEQRIATEAALTKKVQGYFVEYLRSQCIDAGMAGDMISIDLTNGKIPEGLNIPTGLQP